MMVMFTPVAAFKSSADRFCVLPGLMVPTLNWPGLARAAAITSFIVRNGDCACVSSSRSK
jgi:hypothetical protein